MTIEIKLPIDGIKLRQVPFDAQSQELCGLFAAELSGQMEAASTQAFDNQSDPLADGVKTLKKDGFTGFFKKLQEEKMKELREKILEEMGLSEEDLSKMPPEQRAAIEKMIAQEIANRMSAESALENDKETDPIKKRLLLTELDNPMFLNIF